MLTSGGALDVLHSPVKDMKKKLLGKYIQMLNALIHVSMMLSHQYCRIIDTYVYASKQCLTGYISQMIKI
jgi:hypothetical protein